MVGGNNVHTAFPKRLPRDLKEPFSLGRHKESTTPSSSVYHFMAP